MNQGSVKYIKWYEPSDCFIEISMQSISNGAWIKSYKKSTYITIQYLNQISHQVMERRHPLTQDSDWR